MIHYGFEVIGAKGGKVKITSAFGLGCLEFELEKIGRTLIGQGMDLDWNLTMFSNFLSFKCIC